MTRSSVGNDAECTNNGVFGESLTLELDAVVTCASNAADYIRCIV